MSTPAPVAKREDCNRSERPRRAFAEAVARMHQREAREQIARYWRQDHEELEGPQVFCPVKLKWISRADWEEQCRREALDAAVGKHAANGPAVFRSPPRLGPGLEIEYAR